MLKKIEATDVFIFIGLSMIGTGLFFWFGHGVSLTTVGALFFLMGFFSGAITGIRKKIFVFINPEFRKGPKMSLRGAERRSNLFTKRLLRYRSQ